MSFNLGWPANSPAVGARNQCAFKQDAKGHLRIKDLARRIEAADRPQRQDQHAPAATNHLRNSYEISLRNIDDNIYALASATAALDRVENKLSEARAQIERLCDRGEPVDLDKVERTLLALADHVNNSVRRADENYVNLLRDSRLQIRLAEVGGDEERAKQVDLTLISLDKLIAWKLRDGPDDPQDWMDLIDQMSTVASRNVQILSSLILTLFAARDYTSDVVQLVMPAQQELNRPGSATAMAQDFVQSARSALMRDERIPATAKQPNRLMAFLKEVTFQA